MMYGRCPSCNVLLTVKDLAEIFRCPHCGFSGHPEHLKPVK